MLNISVMPSTIRLNDCNSDLIFCAASIMTAMILATIMPTVISPVPMTMAAKITIGTAKFIARRFSCGTSISSSAISCPPARTGRSELAANLSAFFMGPKSGTTLKMIRGTMMTDSQQYIIKGMVFTNISIGLRPSAIPVLSICPIIKAPQEDIGIRAHTVAPVDVTKKVNISRDTLYLSVRLAITVPTARLLR